MSNSKYDSFSGNKYIKESKEVDLSIWLALSFVSKINLNSSAVIYLSATKMESWKQFSVLAATVYSSLMNKAWQGRSFSLKYRLSVVGGKTIFSFAQRVILSNILVIQDRFKSSFQCLFLCYLGLCLWVHKFVRQYYLFVFK